MLLAAKSDAGNGPPSGLGLSLRALASDKQSAFRMFQRDFARSVLECARSNPKAALGSPISFHLENSEQYRLDIDAALQSHQPLHLSVVVCLPSAPDARPMPHHLLLERWLIEYAEATPMKAKDKSPEWQQAAELAKLNKLEAELRASLRQLPLHAFLERRTSATNFVYGTLPGESLSFIQGGCAERIYTLQTEHGTCRLLLEYRADLSPLAHECALVLALVPQASAVMATCFHGTPSSYKTPPSSPDSDGRVSSPSISIRKLSLHNSDGAAQHGKAHYGRRGFSLVSPPQLGSSPPVYRLSSSSNDVNSSNHHVYNSARSPISPPTFVGSMEESLLSGRVSATPCTVLSGFVGDLVVIPKEDALSPRDREKARFPPHIEIPFDALYYHIGDTAPYTATLPLDIRGYRIPVRGTVQLTLRNPSRTPFKTFLVAYDLTQMPAETKTFVRQKTMRGNPPRTCYAIHLRFSSPKAGVYFLAKRIKIIFPLRLPDESEELRVTYDIPRDPQYFPY